MKVLETVYKHDPERPRELTIKIAAQRSLYARFLRRIAAINEKRQTILLQKWLDGFSVIVLFFAVLYFVGIQVFH